MARLRFTEAYEKIAEKFLDKHPELEKRYYKTLQLLIVNPGHPSLRLHKLHGLNTYSVSINLSYRITMEFCVVDDLIVLLNVGGHDEVY